MQGTTTMDQYKLVAQRTLITLFAALVLAILFLLATYIFATIGIAKHPLFYGAAWIYGILGVICLSVTPLMCWAYQANKRAQQHKRPPPEILCQFLSVH